MGLAYAALGAAAVVWGLAFPIMKFAVDRLGPLDVGVVRMAFGAAGALWYLGLSRIGAAATGATAVGIPLVGVAGSWLFLGEPLGPVILVAGILILDGLHLVLGARYG